MHLCSPRLSSFAPYLSFLAVVHSLPVGRAPEWPLLVANHFLSPLPSSLLWLPGVCRVKYYFLIFLFYYFSLWIQFINYLGLHTCFHYILSFTLLLSIVPPKSTTYILTPTVYFISFVFYNPLSLVNATHTCMSTEPSTGVCSTYLDHIPREDWLSIPSQLSIISSSSAKGGSLWAPPHSIS